MLEFQPCGPKRGHARVPPTRRPVGGCWCQRRALRLPANACTLGELSTRRRARRGSFSTEKASLFICIGRRKKSSGSTGAGLLWLPPLRGPTASPVTCPQGRRCVSECNRLSSKHAPWRHRVSTNPIPLVRGQGVRRGPVSSIPAGGSRRNFFLEASRSGRIKHFRMGKLELCLLTLSWTPPFCS